MAQALQQEARPHDWLLLSVDVCDMFHAVASFAGLPNGGNDCKTDCSCAAALSV